MTTIAGLTLEEDAYSADLATLDRYQSFSAELGRLAGLAITGLGILFSNDGVASAKIVEQILRHHWTLMALGLGALLFAIALSLAHRYVSTDAFATLIRSIRLGKAAEQLGDLESQALRIKKMDEMQVLRENLRRSGWLVASASFCLVVGILLSGLAMAMSLT